MKIVVHGTNWIGDAVMTIPALRELRRLFPEDRITLYTKPWAKGVFADADFVDEILCPFLSQGESSLRSEIELWRACKFDLAVLFTNSFRTALLSKIGGAKKRFGYANEFRGFLLSKSFPKPEWKNEKHEVFYYLNLVSAVENELLGTDTVTGSTPDCGLDVSTSTLLKGLETLKTAGIDASKPTVGLGCGSQNSNAKRWPAKSFAELSDLLHEASKH